VKSGGLLYNISNAVLYGTVDGLADTDFFIAIEAEELESGVM
jgi:hypothetical protein